MSNFDFLKDFDDTLWKWGNRIENEINTPSAVKADATSFLEHLLKKLRERHGLGNSTKDFYNQLNELFLNDKISRKYKVDIYSAYQLRNKIHSDLDYIEKTEYYDALRLHKLLFYIAKKYYRDSDEYDEYKGVPSYNPPEIDLTDDEFELLEVPDFLEIVEFKYDYCVICGEPNHSNYSIYCEDCYREIENANNFISIRNNFGKDSKFSKEDLIEFGIHEAYAIQLINSLAKSNLLKVKGRDIYFNNLNIDSYMTKIDNFIRVGELITKFREDKITPSEIKETKEYRQGSFKQDPFYQFYKIINEEIINKFEKNLLSTQNIQDSVAYTTISQKDLTRWYNIQLNQYRKNNSNESFEIYNKLLIDDYFELKSQGFKESEIKSRLNITNEMIEIFPKFNPEFDNILSDIKKDLIIKALTENKSKAEAIQIAGITKKEYDDIIKFSKFKGNEFYQVYQEQINERKEQILISLSEYDLSTSCMKSKIGVDDFYKWYDEADLESEFYIKSTKLLMDKFLDERRVGKSKQEALKIVGLKENILNRWLKRKNKLFDEFKEKNLKVTVDLILKGFKDNKTKAQISKSVEVSVNGINSYLLLGRRGSHLYRELFNYYHSEVIPRNLSKFLIQIKNKPLSKALKDADLSIDELNYYYGTDQNFHDKYIKFKMDMYVDEIIGGRNHETALSRCNISKDEYLQLNDKLDAIILKERMEIIKKDILNDVKTDVAAKHVGVTVDNIYDWYYKGKFDEEFREFSEFFYEHYMEPNILVINKLIKRGNSIESFKKKFNKNFTEYDFEIWKEEGLILKEDAYIDLTEDDENEESLSIYEHHSSGLYENISQENKLSKKRQNSDLYKLVNKDQDDEDDLTTADLFFKQKEPSKSSAILKEDEKDIEKLKKEMGIK